jgi:simple sugar transport system substrate-binding protein
MVRKSVRIAVFVLLLAAMLVTACAPKATPTPTPAVQEPVVVATTAAPPEPFVFGILMVGPYNDHGWSQAHYEAGLYVEEKLGAKMVYIDKVNSADRPGTTPDQLASDLVAQGAKLVIFNSDDMKDAATTFAKANPDIKVIMASGDQVWKDGKAYVAMDNMVNIMGRMEYGKEMAGCAAALTTQTGKIGYLGPLINDETRRLASSAYLGAKYCWTEVLGKNAADLVFKVTWIGFWFNIPGFTSDPTLVADDFIASGFDVIISGIDTTEGLAEAKKAAEGGKAIWAIPYDFIGSCEEGKEVCLGVPYFNWGPAYLETIGKAADGTWESNFQWNSPYWPDINDADKTAVGFIKGNALSAEVGAKLDAFIAALAGGLNLWTGPINLQDGTVYLADGVVGTDQEVWYLPQLLEGMEGLSVSE